MGRGIGRTQASIIRVIYQHGARPMQARTIAAQVYSVGEPTDAMVTCVRRALGALKRRNLVIKTRCHSCWRRKPAGRKAQGRLDDAGQIELPGIEGWRRG